MTSDQSLISDPLQLSLQHCQSAVGVLSPEIISAGLRTESGRMTIEKIEEAINTIGKLIVLLDIDLERDRDKDLSRLQDFRAKG